MSFIKKIGCVFFALFAILSIGLKIADIYYEKKYNWMK